MANMSTAKRVLPALVLIALAVMTVMLMTTPSDPRLEARSPARSARASPEAASLTASVGFAYSPRLSRAPTADRSQSKLWFHDRSWWGVLNEAPAASFGIYRLEQATLEWMATGVLVDDRPEARADVLWSGTHLYAVSGGRTSTAAEHVRLMRYSYDADSQTYGLDGGFPLALTETGVRSLSIAYDSASRLWVSYILGGEIWVRHSDDQGTTWAEPMQLEGVDAGAVIHTILAYGSSTAILWNDEMAGAVYFTSHNSADAADVWTDSVAVVQDAFLTDDHISARSLEGPNGAAIYVMIKTSRDLLADVPDDSQMLLLELQPGGEWVGHVYGRVRDRLTKPLLLIDEERRQLHLFAVAPFGRGSVYYKTTSADAIDLSAGRGTPFLATRDRGITLPTSTKQNLTAESGLVILASDEVTGHYVHASLALPRPLPDG